MVLTILQGTTRSITASAIVGADGAPLDVTGWAVLARLRQNSVTGPVVAEWSTTPTGPQGTATASGSAVTIVITPAMSAAWNWRRGVLHAEITEPGVNGRVERIIDVIVHLDREVVTT